MFLILFATAHCHLTMSATRREGGVAAHALIDARAIHKILDDGEIELNLDQIDPRTFRELDGYMRECLGGD